MKTNQVLYAFNFKPEGYNQVWAETKAEAIAAAKAQFPSLVNDIDTKSFRRLATREAQDAYWNGLPLFD